MANKFICNLCYPDFEEIGEIAPGLWLAIDNKETYYLVGGQGHSDEIYWQSKIKPRKDPTLEVTDQQWMDDETYLPQFDAWLDQVSEEMYYLDIDAENNTTSIDKSKLLMHDIAGNWRLVETLKEGGYDPILDASAEFWIYNRMGELIEEKELAEI